MEQENEKSITINGVTYKYSSEWIYSLENEIHWQLYWQQQNIMRNRVSPGQKVLEIGVGTGFTANYLRSKGVHVTTFDIDPGKHPDLLGNLVTYDFPDLYDHFLAFEVFEHIPFNELTSVLAKISQVCKGCLFLSVPRNEKLLFRLQIQILNRIKKTAELAIKRQKIITKTHHWEVDYREYSKRKLEEAFLSAGFNIIHVEKKFSLIFYTLKSPYVSTL